MPYLTSLYHRTSDPPGHTGAPELPPLEEVTESRDQRLKELGLVVILLAGTQSDLGAGVTKDAPRS